MSPIHHPSEELLLGYAAGSLGEALELVVATHIALCPPCRSQVFLLEEVGGAYLESASPAPAGPPPAELLARLEEAAPEDQPLARPAAATGPKVPILPEPLRSLAGGDVGDLRFHLKAPGVREVELPIPGPGMPVRIARLSRWLTIPMHTHKGTEYTLILSGGLKDEFGVFERGDLAVYDPSHRHEQRVLPGEPCVCLVVNTDRLVPLTLLGRILARVADV